MLVSAYTLPPWVLNTPTSINSCDFASYFLVLHHTYCFSVIFNTSVLPFSILSRIVEFHHPNMVDNRLIRYGIRAVQLLFAIIIMGTDGYCKLREYNVPCQHTDYSNKDSSLRSYPHISRPYHLHSPPRRRLLPFYRRPQCVGISNILCWIFSTDCIFHLHMRVLYCESQVDRLRSYRSRGSCCPVVARWFRGCGRQHFDKIMF